MMLSRLSFHKPELCLLTRVLSRFIQVCLKQNTKTLRGFSLKSNRCWNRHHFDHQLGRLAALESAFRPNLSLGTQVAFFVTLRVLNYIISIISLGGY
jgi:hypothetical protein